MTRVHDLAAIKRALVGLDLVPDIEAGFVALSEGRANIPPVGELMLEKGEVHIKYGAIAGDSHYVVKIASGFYGNAARGLASGNGLMLLFDQETGVPTSVLLDEGHLTDVRTAIAGAVAAKHFAPRDGGPVGIIGLGVQARLQLLHLRGIVACERAIVFGRDTAKAERYRADMVALGFQIEIARSAAELAARCRLIVTTTPATAPLLFAADIRPGTHITAIGSDTPHKQELDAAILAKADLVIADSLPQARLRGEIHKALAAGAIDESRIVELGAVIARRRPGRTRADEITVFDSTGVAVQDIKIAAAVAARLGGEAGAPQA